jgi:hypothetical protein
MEGIFPFHQQEIIDQTSITEKSLRSDTALARDQVIGLISGTSRCRLRVNAALLTDRNIS